MAKVDIKMPDEFLERMSRLGKDFDAVAESVLEAGGEVVLQKVQSNLSAVVGSGTKHESRSTGELESALGLTPAKTDKDGNPVTAPPFIEYFVTIEDPLCEVTKAESTVKKIVKNAKLPDNYGDFGDGEMTIDKYVLNGSEEYTVTDTFYFTLFRDEELKIPYEQFETKKLDLNDEAHGTATFGKLPYGVYYLAETDADGKPVGDGFDYEVKIEKKQFTISETNKKETIRIDNCITPDTPGGKHTPKTPGGGDKPKTGDDTLIWLYVTMMLAALVAGTGSIFGKRRRKRSSK